MGRNVGLRGCAGTRGPMDVVEVPSHLLEHFARAPAVLAEAGRHWRTREPPPAQLLDALSRRKRLFGALRLQQQARVGAAAPRQPVPAGACVGLAVAGHHTTVPGWASWRVCRVSRRAARARAPASRRGRGASGAARSCRPAGPVRGRRGACARGRQVADAVMDQRLHGPQPAGGSTAVVAAAMAEHSAVPYVPGTHPQARCGAPPAAAPPVPRTAPRRTSARDPDGRADETRDSRLSLQGGLHAPSCRARGRACSLPLCGRS
jgi:hypothetical protein